jgi:hypothetical protein
MSTTFYNDDFGDNVGLNRDYYNDDIGINTKVYEVKISASDNVLSIEDDKGLKANISLDYTNGHLKLLGRDGALLGDVLISGGGGGSSETISSLTYDQDSKTININIDKGDGTTRTVSMSSTDLWNIYNAGGGIKIDYSQTGQSATISVDYGYGLKYDVDNRLTFDDSVMATDADVAQAVSGLVQNFDVINGGTW